MHQCEWNTHNINCNPDEPKLHPATRHRKGRERSSREDPGVDVEPLAVVTLTQDLKYLEEDEVGSDDYREQNRSLLRGGPAWGDDGPFNVELLVTSPNDPAIDAHNHEQEISSSLAVEGRVICRLGE